MRLQKKTSKLVANSWLSLQNINNGDSGSRKTNSLSCLISHQPDIDKIYLCAKDPYEARYQMLINWPYSVGCKLIDRLYLIDWL